MPIMKMQVKSSPQAQENSSPEQKPAPVLDGRPPRPAGNPPLNKRVVSEDEMAAAVLAASQPSTLPGKRIVDVAQTEAFAISKGETGGSTKVDSLSEVAPDSTAVSLAKRPGQATSHLETKGAPPIGGGAAAVVKAPTPASPPPKATARPVVEEIEQPAPRTKVTKEQADANMKRAVKSYSEQNPEFFSIDLPSNFIYYPFKSLSMRTMKGIHQSKMNRAAEEDNIRHVVDAIGSTLEPGISAYDLSPQDFYFLMYWQRVYSYPKTPLVIRASCTNKDHLLEVAEGKKDKKTLEIDEIVNSTTLRTRELPYTGDYKEALMEHLSERAQELFLENLHIMHIETMRDVVEANNLLIAAEKTDTKKELEWQLGYASYLHSVENGVVAPLEARAAVIADMNPDDIETFDEYIRVVTNYGVDESANIRCRDCGAMCSIPLPIDAVTFLPGVQRRIAT